MRVIVKSPFSIFAGYGQDGYGMVRALDRWGCDVYVQPQWQDVPIPRDILHLWTKQLEGPYDLVINHWDPANLNMRSDARSMTRCAVAWTMWEFAPAPGPVTMTRQVQGDDGEMVTEEYLDEPKSGLIPHCGHLEDKEGEPGLSKRLELFDLVLGYDSVTMASLEPYIPEHVGRAILQGGYESREWKQEKRDWHTPTDFTYLMHGALNSRKVPWTVVEAWVQLCQERPEFVKGAKLMCHTLVPGLFPEMNEIYKDKRLRVLMEPLTHEELQQFYANGHVLLTPSRGEGKNLPALEFMTTGGVVAATNFGGHTQWLNDAYAYPLDYDLRPTFAQRPDAAHDAKVSVQTVKDAIWHIYTHRDEAREKAELAAQTIPKMCDWEVVVEKLFERIRDNCPFNGELIWSMAQEARRDKQKTVRLRDQHRVEPDVNRERALAAQWRPE